MKITLDSDNTFITNKGKLDVNRALIVAGVKAAVCFKQPDAATKQAITPKMIRENESESQLILRGLNTVLSDHTTPSEQFSVGLNIVGIPKILCMVLNNEKFLAACERSLRYTSVEENNSITKSEFQLYTKWKSIMTDLLMRDYGSYFLKASSGNEKKAYQAAAKIAQENARNFITVFMPTTLTQTLPFAQINKVATYMQKLIDTPNSSQIKELLKPYITDFIQQLKSMDVLLTNNRVKQIVGEYNIVDIALEKDKPNFINIPDNDELFYKNNKNISLSLFAEDNKFSGINYPNQYGPSINYNFNPSFSSLAQYNRHRTSEFEIMIPEHFIAYIPPFIQPYPDLVAQYISDIKTVQNLFPQGQIIDANLNSSLSSILNFIGKERACINAQFETFDIFANQITEDIYNGLLSSQQYASLAAEVKPYVKKLRCQTGDYCCPSNCGRPTMDRKY